MKCPKCKKELVLPNRVYANFEFYNVGGSSMVASECCNTGFVVKMKVKYKITKYTGDKQEDDWGVKLDKP